MKFKENTTSLVDWLVKFYLNRQRDILWFYLCSQTLHKKGIIDFQELLRHTGVEGATLESYKKLVKVSPFELN